jgi:hypothetical protein
MKIALKVPCIAYMPPKLTKHNLCVWWEDRIWNYSMYEILQSEISQIFKVFFLEKLRVAEDMSRKHKISEVIFRIALFLITIAATIFSYIVLIMMNSTLFNLLNLCMKCSFCCSLFHYHSMGTYLSKLKLISDRTISSY